MNQTELKSPIGKAFGFYNVENLFDTIDSKYTIDEQFLPSSEKAWNTKKYFEYNKSSNLLLQNFDVKSNIINNFCFLCY